MYHSHAWETSCTYTDICSVGFTSRGARGDRSYRSGRPCGNGCAKDPFRPLSTWSCILVAMKSCSRLLGQGARVPPTARTSSEGAFCAVGGLERRSPDKAVLLAIAPQGLFNETVHYHGSYTGSASAVVPLPCPLSDNMPFSSAFPFPLCSREPSAMLSCSLSLCMLAGAGTSRCFKPLSEAPLAAACDGFDMLTEGRDSRNAPPVSWVGTPCVDGKCVVLPLGSDGAWSSKSV